MMNEILFGLRADHRGRTKKTTLRDTGLPIVIVTSVGDKTDATQKTPLMRVKDSNDYVLVGSQLGAPLWWH